MNSVFAQTWNLSFQFVNDRSLSVLFCFFYFAEDLEDKCEKFLCKCDREAAKCLRKAPYIQKYALWPDFMCGSEHPTCNMYWNEQNSFFIPSAPFVVAKQHRHCYKHKNVAGLVHQLYGDFWGLFIKKKEKKKKTLAILCFILLFLKRCFFF